MLYLTFGDAYSGVFSSQVIDVVRHLKTCCDARFQLLSFQAPKIYFAERKRIKKHCKKAILLPAYPGLTNWRTNVGLLSLVTKVKRPEVIIARGVFAANLALEMRNKGLIRKVVYDARGAVAAEWEEYEYGQSDELTQSVIELEQNAVLHSDMRIAVSKRLVGYWRDRFNYQDDKYEVIPCLLSDEFLEAAHDASLHRTKMRNQLGYDNDSIVLVFSGGIGGWQSPELLGKQLRGFLDSDERVQILMLSKKNKQFDTLLMDYSDRVKLKWVDPGIVPYYLAVADYGLLLREPSVTNTVAAPTKFAEYLGLGLKVLISSNVGDYSDFVVEHGCGYIIDEGLPVLGGVHQREKVRVSELAQHYFVKSRFNESYKKLVTGPSF